jgi:hypothetical protein
LIRLDARQALALACFDVRVDPAQGVAWSAPGVAQVVNELQVEWLTFTTAA